MKQVDSDFPARPFLRVARPTVWSRLFCSARDSSMSLGQQVQVRDPLWFLARQWQVGEFNGFDGGSPINAAYCLQQSLMTAYKPWSASAASALTAAQIPLEVKVEAESVALGLRGSMQLGLRFEAIVMANSSMPQSDISAARIAFPIDSAASASELPDPPAIVLRAAIAGKITDGWKLCQAVLASPQASSVGTFLSANATAASAVAQFTSYCQSLYAAAPPQSPWNAEDLKFEFTDAAETATGSVRPFRPRLSRRGTRLVFL